VFVEKEAMNGCVGYRFSARAIADACAGPRGLFFVLCLQPLLWQAAPAGGQVVINEIVAAGSDRLLQRNVSGYPKLGLTAPWQTAAYDDALWSKGKGPFGFGAFSNVTFGVNTSAAMQGKLPALYVRKAFTVTGAQAADTNQLELVTRYNDGFIAFVNGVEVARITKTFEGIAMTMFTTADNYVVQIHTQIPQPLNSLVVAAALSVDTALKQDSRGFG